MVQPAAKKNRMISPSVEIDPENYELLKKFVTEYGKILPAKTTGVTAKQQRQIKRAIRRARVMGLLP